MPKRRKGGEIAGKGAVKATKAMSGAYPDWLTKQRRNGLTKFLVNLNQQQLDNGHAEPIACGSANQDVMIRCIATNCEAFEAAKVSPGRRSQNFDAKKFATGQVGIKREER